MPLLFRDVSLAHGNVILKSRDIFSLTFIVLADFLPAIFTTMDVIFLVFGFQKSSLMLFNSRSVRNSLLCTKLLFMMLYIFLNFKMYQMEQRSRNKHMKRSNYFMLIGLHSGSLCPYGSHRKIARARVASNRTSDGPKSFHSRICNDLTRRKRQLAV